MIRVFQAVQCKCMKHWFKVFLVLNFLNCFGSQEDPYVALGIPQNTARGMSRPTSADIEWMYQINQGSGMPVGSHRIPVQPLVREGSRDDVELVVLNDEDGQEVEGRLSPKVFLGSPSAEVEPSFEKTLQRDSRPESRASRVATPATNRQSSQFLPIAPLTNRSDTVFEDSKTASSKDRMGKLKNNCSCTSCWNGCLHSIISCLQSCRCQEDLE